MKDNTDIDAQAGGAASTSARLDRDTLALDYVRRRDCNGYRPDALARDAYFYADEMIRASVNVPADVLKILSITQPVPAK